MRDRVCVATVTWARSEGEQQLLRASLLRLAEPGLTIVVSGRDSGPAFRECLESHQQIRVVPRPILLTVAGLAA
ncbi:MAG: hypothetical protein M3545_09465 [Acidobacteriota bacterium]|nr:hypothetical protein [Acidobacteriota bacterium]